MALKCAERYQVLFALNPLSTCWTVSGTMALSGAPLIFPSIDIATSPWSAAPMVRAKRFGIACDDLSCFLTLFRHHRGMRHPSPAARAIRNNPAATTTAPMARATRSPAGARRSTVMAAVTTAIARRSMTPMTRRIAIRPAQQ